MTKEILEQEFKNGLWHADIAQKYNISIRSIYQYVKKWNIIVPRKNAKIKRIKLVCPNCGKQYKTLLPSGICYNCETHNAALKKNNAEFSNSKSELGKQIISLRKQGLTFSEIKNILHCSKSTISYHCSNKIRISKQNKFKKEQWKTKFLNKLWEFENRKIGNGKSPKNKDWNKKFRTAVSRFQTTVIKANLTNAMSKRYSYKEAIEHIGGTITKCYLTGRSINILTDDYSLDHIVPVSKGGSNDLSNMGIVCPEANASKSDMILEDYLNLCKEVLENNGYIVTKISNIDD